MSLSTLHLDAASTHTWDVLVIGSGPCGSVAAREAARRGLRTLLVEKSSMPRPKVCGGCLAQGGIATLQRLGLDHVLGGATTLGSLTVRAFARRASVHVRELRGVDRAHMDALLLRAAVNAGAHVLDQTLARVHSAAEGAVDLRCGQNTRRIAARSIIVADGISGGSLADAPPFDWIVARHSKVGLGAVAQEPLNVDPHTIVMCVNRDGYVGLAPIAHAGTAVAAAIRPEALGRDGGARALLAGILRDAGMRLDLPDDLPLRGTAQLTRRRTCVESGRVLIAGDAAGYVEPFTGEGMSWALRSGELAAAFAVQLAEQRLAPGAWTHTLRHELTHAKRRCALVAGVLDRPGLLKLSMTLAEAAPRFAAAVSSAFGRVAQERVA